MTGVDVLGLGIALPGTDKPSEAPDSQGEPAPDWFDVAAALPGRGYRRLPPACQYLLAAAGNAVADAGGPLAAIPAERRGVVVGTNNAAAALIDEQDRAILDQDAQEISPLTAPYFAVSLFASRLAIEHEVRGFALTVNTPRTAGLDALQIGGRALAAGRADLLIVGVTEEGLPPGEPGAEGSDLGAVALVCAPAARAPNRAAHGACRVRSAFLPPGAAPAEALAGAWADLTAGRPGPPRVEAVLDDSPVGRAVAAWLAATGAEVFWHPAGAGALSPMLHLVGMLAGGPGPDRALVTASVEGNVAFALLTLPPHDHSR